MIKRTARILKSCLAPICSVLTLIVSGCCVVAPDTDTVSETITDTGASREDSREEVQDDAEEIISACIDLYEEAGKKNRADDPETIQAIVSRLGENGYPAVDQFNQVNMSEACQVLEFCEKVDAREEAEITILEVDYSGGFVKYDLQAKDGNVDVTKSRYQFEDGVMQRKFIGSCQADYWKYTEEGYLMFSGILFSEELYVLTLSGIEEHTALRVQPLDETCRKLSCEYLRPIGFARNNMFLVDWSEDDFGDLDFYDLYDILYPKVNGEDVPYAASDNLAVSAVYQIPKEEFESVIMDYFNIDSETLQSKTVFYPDEASYEYRPRGFEEAEYPEYPYSEVVDYKENRDGTITLTANVVFPYAGDSKVFVHEVVVRPSEDGKVKYVSNRIISSDGRYKETWHMPRLTFEEWKVLYGDE